MALIAGGVGLTYEELEAEASRAARRLAARGVRRGGNVVIAQPSGLEYVITLHALMKLGAVVHPLNPGLAPNELDAEVERAKPALVIGEPEHVTMSEADLPLLGEHDLDALHCRILTSGTSGSPRSVGLTYGNHLWSAVGSAFNLGVDPADRWLCCLPMHHVAGLQIVMRSVIYGTGAVVHDGFDTEGVAESFERDGVTLASLVTTQLARLLAAGVDLSRPRAILVGGGPGPDRRARGGNRARRLRCPDLRHDRDRVPGHDARASGRAAKAGLRGAPAPDDPSADLRRRDLRPGPRRGAGLR